MILIVNGEARTVCGGGVCTRTDPQGDPVRDWCLAAMPQGYDIAGMQIEMHMANYRVGRDIKTGPMLALTYPDALLIFYPPRKPKKGSA